MKSLIRFTALALSFGLLAVGAGNLDESEYLNQARSSSKDLMQTLKGTLMGAMKSEGPKAAVNVCSEVAQDLASSISEKHDLKIKRVSLDYRNPTDQPDEFETKALKDFLALQKEGKLNEKTEFFAFTNNGEKQSQFRYLKPIVAQKACLQCHGNPENMKPGVAALLREKYPDDKALNHQVGDIRGAVSVTIDLKDSH